MIIATIEASGKGTGQFRIDDQICRGLRDIAKAAHCPTMELLFTEGGGTQLAYSEVSALIQEIEQLLGEEAIKKKQWDIFLKKLKEVCVNAIPAGNQIKSEVE